MHLKYLVYVNIINFREMFWCFPLKISMRFLKPNYLNTRKTFLSAIFLIFLIFFADLYFHVWDSITVGCLIYFKRHIKGQFKCILFFFQAAFPFRIWKVQQFSVSQIIYIKVYNIIKTLYIKLFLKHNYANYMEEKSNGK